MNKKCNYEGENLTGSPLFFDFILTGACPIIHRFGVIYCRNFVSKKFLKNVSFHR